MGEQLVERSRRLTGLACVRAITVGYKTLTFISLRTPVARVQPLVAKHGGVCGEREKEEAINRESQLWYILRSFAGESGTGKLGRFVPRSYIHSVLMSNTCLGRRFLVYRQRCTELPTFGQTTHRYGMLY